MIDDGVGVKAQAVSVLYKRFQIGDSKFDGLAYQTGSVLMVIVPIDFLIADRGNRRSYGEISWDRWAEIPIISRVDELFRVVDGGQLGAFHNNVRQSGEDRQQLHSCQQIHT